MQKEVNGYLVVEVAALKSLGLVRIINSLTNRCVGTCSPDEADHIRESLPPAADNLPVAPTASVDVKKLTKNSATTARVSSGGTTSGAKTAKNAQSSGTNGGSTADGTDLQGKDVRLSTLITALRKEYKASHANQVWRVPVECCIASGGVIMNSLNNPSDRKKRTFSDEEIGMLVFSPDGVVRLCKEYEHSDGTIATVDKEGLNFVFDMDKVKVAEDNGVFPLQLLRKGGKLTSAWHIQDSSTYADRSRAIVYDLETTGVKDDENGNPPEILQLTVMDFNGKVVLNDYFKPEYTLDWSEAAAVNGITAEVVAGKASFRSRLPEIQALFDNATLIVGYNSNSFDDGVLKKNGITFKEDVPHYDVMLHYQKVFGMHGLEQYGKGNSYLMQKLTLAYLDCIGNVGGAKETVLGAHDAANDTRMTLQLFEALQTNDLTRDTPHWVSLFFRGIVRNKGKVFGSQEEATKLWTDMFYLPMKDRIDAMRKHAGKGGFPALPKVWDLARYCK